MIACPQFRTLEMIQRLPNLPLILYSEGIRILIFRDKLGSIPNLISSDTSGPSLDWGLFFLLAGLSQSIMPGGK